MEVGNQKEFNRFFEVGAVGAIKGKIVGFHEVYYRLS